MLTRRSVMLGSAAMAISPQFAVASGRSLELWPDSPPGGGGPTGPVLISPRGAISNIATPSLKVVAPLNPNGSAVLIAAGGGYKRIQIAKEANPAATWLTARGITTFVLTYRLPREDWNAGASAPLQDIQRAIRLIRASADRYRLDPERLGLLGFSAGGHLAGIAAVRSDFASYPPIDAIDERSARPSLAALIYPVITLKPPFDKTWTRRLLIGEKPSPADSANWSVETHVNASCPPVFLVHAADDDIANPAHSQIMAAACQRAGVSVEFHLLPNGRHGFPLTAGGAPALDWPGWFDAWMRKTGFFG